EFAPPRTPAPAPAGERTPPPQTPPLPLQGKGPAPVPWRNREKQNPVQSALRPPGEARQSSSQISHAAEASGPNRVRSTPPSSHHPSTQSPNPAEPAAPGTVACSPHRRTRDPS